MTVDVDNLVLNCGLALVSALAGAYGGTRAATAWQTRMQTLADQRKSEASLLRSMFICRHFARMVDKVKAKLFDGERPREWQEVNVIGIWLTNEVSHEVQPLSDALHAENWELVEDATHAEWVSKSVFAVVQQRDIEFSELQKFILKKGAPGKMTKDEAIALIGAAWASKLDSITRDLQNAIIEAAKQNLDVHNRLAAALQRKKKPSWWASFRLYAKANSFIERTSPGKPGPASHVKR